MSNEKIQKVEHTDGFDLVSGGGVIVVGCLLYLVHYFSKFFASRSRRKLGKG